MNLKKSTPVLFVKDAKQSRNFYVDILGMTVTADFRGLNFVFEEGLAIWQILDDNIVVETLGRDNIENCQIISRFEICF